jgi:hypothetical protein
MRPGKKGNAIFEALFGGARNANFGENPIGESLFPKPSRGGRLGREAHADSTKEKTCREIRALYEEIDDRERY